MERTCREAHGEGPAADGPCDQHLSPVFLGIGAELLIQETILLSSEAAALEKAPREHSPQHKCSSTPGPSSGAGEPRASRTDAVARSHTGGKRWENQG